MNTVCRTLFLPAVLLLPLQVFAQTPPQARQMTPLDILNIPSLSVPSVSPDGRAVVYRKRVSDWNKNKQVADLWLSRVDSAEDRQLTFDEHTESAVRWSPDGRFISFLAKRKSDSHKRIYLLPMAGGEAFALAGHRADIENYQWSRDGKSIYFLADEPLDAAIEKRKKAKDDMFTFEQPLSYRHIWKVDIDSGGGDGSAESNDNEVEKITSGEFFVRAFSLSPDNQLIAYSRAAGLAIDDRHAADIWVLPAGGEARRVTDNTIAEGAIQVSPDNKKILFIADANAAGEYYYDGNLFVVDIASGTVTLLAGEQTFEVEQAQWARSSRWIYIRANMGVRSELWRVGVRGGGLKQLTDGVHTVAGWRYDSVSDRHGFVLTSPTSPGEIWLLPGGGGRAVQVSDVHGDFARRYRLPQQRLLRWQAQDGTPIEGLLSLPLDYREGRRYPTVVHSHGGPHSSDQYGQFRWRTYIPVLAAMGYAYFSPNYRGGRGYGDAFMRDMVGGYFNNAHLDVLSGVDYLVAQGIADPGALIKTGWSAGGHMTNKIITVTDRFKAASSGAGAVDWVSMYGESDTRYGRTPWFGGTPWQQHAPLDIYREHSPLKDMWRVKTPTIIYVGEKDIRVPPTQSILLYRALQDLGVESRLYIAPREKHGFAELRHRLFKINSELAWFERHARGRAYQWQQAPEQPAAD